MPKRSASRGLSPQLFGGLNQKRMTQRTGGGGNRVIFKDDDPTVTLQFLDDPGSMKEYYRHVFQEDGSWNFVPCAGKEDCPLCDSENERTRQLSYCFAANVIDIKTGQVRILEGPQNLATRVFNKWKRKPGVFLKRVYDITKFPTKPISYNFELAEEDPVTTRGKKKIDLQEYVINEMKRYYGDDLNISPVSLQDEEDDEVEDDDETDEYAEADLKKLAVSALADIAEELEIDPVPKTKPKLIAAILLAQGDDEEDEEDEDDEEEDEDWDDEEEDDEDEDDDDEEDEDPPARRPKKAAPRKAVAARKRK